MGISGLLVALNSIVVDAHIKEYAGTKVGVDVSCWLHKAAYSCSFELVQNQPTDKYIAYCMNRIFLLQQHNITPVIVFDGALLPMKRQTIAERKK